MPPAGGKFKILVGLWTLPLARVVCFFVVQTLCDDNCKVARKGRLVSTGPFAFFVGSLWANLSCLALAGTFGAWATGFGVKYLQN